MMFKNEEEMQHALSELLKKYHIRQDGAYNLSPGSKANGLKLWPGWAFIDATPEENQVPLLTWRVKRKFLELKKIVQDATVENPRMFRFSCTGNKEHWNWRWLLYRELDLCEFIGNGKIISLNAVIAGNEACNVILRLGNGILCSIEISTRLPGGRELVDRHEIIARRGVAGDLVVDTMIPQHSIYSFTEDGIYQYRDVDEELFGFDEDHIDLIRAAFQVLKHDELIGAWRVQHDHLSGLVRSVVESDKQRKKIIFNKKEKA